MKLFNPEELKILILSGTTNNQLPFAYTFWENNREYATRHGYSWVQVEEPDFYFDFDEYHLKATGQRAPTWTKVAMMSLALQTEEWGHFDAVMWIDADAVIMNHTKPLTEIWALNDEYDIYIAPDSNSLNTGVFVMRNTPFVRELLEQWSMMGFRSREWIKPAPMFNNLEIDFQEQGAFWELYEQNWKDLMSQTLVRPPGLVNSTLRTEVWRSPALMRYQYRREQSFILHLAGVPDYLRTKLWFERYKDEVIK